MNKKELIRTNPHSMMGDLKLLRERVDTNHEGLLEGFKLAYVALINALSNRDGALLGKITEPTLRDVITDAFGLL